jgi:hypothetical protein
MPLLTQTDLRTLSMRDQLGNFLNAHDMTGKGVEVGTLYGAYAIDILKQWRGHLYCVDPWMNQPKSVYFDGANKENMQAIWEKVRAGVGRHPRCHLLRMLSLNAVGKFADGELDFVYDDGNHAVESVRADLISWWPKVKIGGLVCGHDFFTRYDADTNSDALTAVNELAAVIGVQPHVTWDTSWWLVKTKEADEQFRAANLLYKFPRPVYTDNREIPLVVVIPVARFDWHQAKKLLRWIESLADHRTEPTVCSLVVLASPTITDGEREQLDTSGRVVAADWLKELGYFGTPNQVIKGALEYVEKNFPGHAMLFVEADAVPMRSTWLDEIRREYYFCGRPFMGDFFREGDIPHMTGNAVYHPNWRVLAPSLAALGTEECAWDTLCAHETMPRAHCAKTIQQIWRPSLPITAAYVHSNVRPETALFHQCKDSSLIDVLCQQAGMPLIPLDRPLCESTYATQRHGALSPLPNIPGDFVPSPATAAAAPPASPGTEILIVTFRRDIEFLRYCLKSIVQFARGFSGVTLVVPSAEKGLYDGWKPGAVTVKYFDEAPGKGMLHHEVQICRADEWCPNADAILHLDPDCVFWRTVTPADLCPGGRPLLVRERYADIAPRNPNRLIWQKCVEAATGIVPEFETMVRHPQIHLRGVYAKTRELVETHTGRTFDDFVLSRENAFPQGFCEYNTLGAVALTYYADRYTVVDYDQAAEAREFNLDPSSFQYLYRRDRDFVIECWSHGGIERYRGLLEGVLQNKRPAYVLK